MVHLIFNNLQFFLVHVLYRSLMPPLLISFGRAERHWKFRDCFIRNKHDDRTSKMGCFAHISDLFITIIFSNNIQFQYVILAFIYSQSLKKYFITRDIFNNMTKYLQKKTFPTNSVSHTTPIKRGARDVPQVGSPNAQLAKPNIARQLTKGGTNQV